MTKAEQRAAMPECTKFIDDIRNAFGAENIVRIKASENGHVVDWIKSDANLRRVA